MINMVNYSIAHVFSLLTWPDNVALIGNVAENKSCSKAAEKYKHPSKLQSIQSQYL